MPSVFLDAKQPPDDAALATALGAAKPAWDAVAAGLPGEWKFYGAKHGWQLRAAEKKRVLVYLIPGAGSFVAALALRDDGVAALAAAPGVPAALVRAVKEARPGPEGRPARVEVKTRKDAELVKKLVALKRG